MKLLINDAKKIEKLIVMFRVLKQFTNSIVVNCDEEKMYIQAIDQWMVSIAEYTLYREWFDEYSIPEETTFGINTSILCSVLGCYIENGNLEMELDGDRLYISYNTKDEKAIITHKNYTVPLIDVTNDLLSIPESDYEADLEMTTSIFNAMVSEIATFSGGINFKISEESIQFETVGTFANQDTIDCNCVIDVDIENVDAFSIDEGCSFTVSYATKYISLISSFSKIFKNIEMNISPELPLKIKFCEENNYEIIFYIAPRIEEN